MAVAGMVAYQCGRPWAIHGVSDPIALDGGGLLKCLDYGQVGGIDTGKSQNRVETVPFVASPSSGMTVFDLHDAKQGIARRGGFEDIHHLGLRTQANQE